MTDTAIQKYLAAHVRRRRLLLAVRTLAWAITAVICSALLACVADRLFALSPTLRVVALIATAAVPVAVVAHPIHRLCRHIDPVAAAAAIERDHPVFAHRLVTAASPGGSADLRSAVEREVLDLIAATGPARVPRRDTAVATAIAVVLLVLLTFPWRWAWLDLPDLARRLAHPRAPIAAVTSTRLTVHPGSADVVEGRPLTITATAAGAIGSAGVTLHLSDDDGQTWTERTMAPAGGSFAVTLASVDRGLRYTVAAGDAVSPTYDVRVHRVPGVVAVRVRLDYPAALHHPATSQTELSFAAPVGTTATVEVVATIPLRLATLSVGKDRIDMAATADPCVRRAQFEVRRNERITLQLVSADGVPSTSPKTARMRVQADPVSDVPGFAAQQRAYRESLRRR